MKRLSLLALLIAAVAAADDMPKVLDDRLKLELIAEAPVVRTPTGIAIDEHGRVYVIESHTHFRPNGYDGPKTDRILRFEKKGDKYEPSVFFEGTTHTMGCGFHPDGSLYVATRNLVFKLVDKNDNGKIDEQGGERVTLIHHETKGNYPHNGLSGFAFDFAGNVYFGQGENLGVDYKVVARDGKTLSGGGEGGNVYCMKADGSGLRRVATGFWNPFHLYMDPFGRLFAVDNDPDSRPPCRLIHVVEGGDYGYRFRNGRKGTHPYTAWNGELPGTLPMVSGTGEAPSGIVGYPIDGPLSGFFGCLLVTSWGDHRIEKHSIHPRGASFGGQFDSVVVGGENFRPVGIAIDEAGSIWFSDWVDKSYQLHSKGRIWRLSLNRAKVKSLEWNKPLGDLRNIVRDVRLVGPLPEEVLRLVESDANSFRDARTFLFSMLALEAGSERDRKIRAAIAKDGTAIPKDRFGETCRAFALGGALGKPPLLSDDFDVRILTTDDANPEIRYAATRRLDPTKHLDRLFELLGDPDPFIQQAARFALKPVADKLGGFGIEPRPDKRLGIALILREANTEHGRKQIPEMLHDPDPRVRFVAIQWIGEERLKDVWQTWKGELEKNLATRQELEAFLATSAFLSDEKYDPGKEAPGEEFVVKMLLDKNTRPERQAFLLRMLPAGYPEVKPDQLNAWFKSDSPALRLAVLGWVTDGVSTKHFGESNALPDTALSEKLPLEERLEAIAAMTTQATQREPVLAKLLNDKHPLIATQAGRTIRTDEKLAAAHWIAFGPAGRTPATDLAAWLKILDKQPGDPKSGGLVFHHAVSQCNRCHEVEGRGGEIGPNLTGIGRTMSRERLIQSILQPSKEIAPQFAVWQLETHDGRILKGMYVGEEVDGTVIYANEQGQTFKLHPRDVSERTQQPISIMPEGLAYRLTDQELRDLLAYLGSNTGK